MSAALNHLRCLPPNESTTVDRKTPKFECVAHSASACALISVGRTRRYLRPKLRALRAGGQVSRRASSAARSRVGSISISAHCNLLAERSHAPKLAPKHTHTDLIAHRARAQPMTKISTRSECNKLVCLCCVLVRAHTHTCNRATGNSSQRRPQIPHQTKCVGQVSCLCAQRTQICRSARLVRAQLALSAARLSAQSCVRAPNERTR